MVAQDQVKLNKIWRQTIGDVHENSENYNPTKKRKVLIVFDDRIADLEVLWSWIVLRRRKRAISFVFTSQSYFKVPKTIRPNARHYFIMNVPNKWELQQIQPNLSSDIEIKVFMKFYKHYTKKLYHNHLFLVHDTTLLSDNPLTFRKNYYKMTFSKTIKRIDHKIQSNKLNTI